jgi:hypothetical protein
MVHVSYGYGLFTGGLGAHYGAEKLGLTVVPFGGGQTERQVQLIQDFKPDIIMVTPSYMLAIADEFERQGWTRAEQPAHRHLRRRALDQRHARWRSRRLGLNAVDIYGLSEVMGPGVASECVRPRTAPPSGKTISTPRSSTPRPASRWPTARMGELVFTSLTKEALPIIRYRTRDLTRLLPGTARTMRRMEKITGRSDDMMIVRGVNVFPTQIEELILKRPELTRALPVHAHARRPHGQPHRGGGNTPRRVAREHRGASGGQDAAATRSRSMWAAAWRSSCAPKAASNAARARPSAWSTSGVEAGSRAGLLLNVSAIADNDHSVLGRSHFSLKSPDQATAGERRRPRAQAERTWCLAFRQLQRAA